MSMKSAIFGQVCYLDYKACRLEFIAFLFLSAGKFIVVEDIKLPRSVPCGLTDPVLNGLLLNSCHNGPCIFAYLESRRIADNRTYLERLYNLKELAIQFATFYYRAMSPHHVQLVINGQKRLSSSGETFETYHPGTKQHTGHVESASSTDIQEAIQAASAASPAWERVLAHKKRDILNKAADLLESQKYVQRFVESVAQEIGAVPVTGALEVRIAARLLRESEPAFRKEGNPLI